MEPDQGHQWSLLEPRYRYHFILQGTLMAFIRTQFTSCMDLVKAGFTACLPVMDEFNISKISSLKPGNDFLTFTFVPISGTLPTPVSFGKNFKSIPPILVCRKEEMTEKPKTNSQPLLRANIKEADQSPLDCRQSSTTDHVFQGKVVSSSNLEDTAQNDLFIAEFVLVMDSDEDRDDIMDKNNQSLSSGEGNYETRVNQSITPEPKPAIPLKHVNKQYVPEVQQDYELSHDVDCQDTELRLHSSAGSIPCIQHHMNKTKYTLSKHNLSENPESSIHSFIPASNNYMSLHKTKTPSTGFLDVPVYTQFTQSYDLHSNATETSSFSSKTDFQDQCNVALGKTACERSNALSPLPIHIFKHPLCPSPSPLQSPYYGSSSTICSNSMSQGSTHMPSRLSFLTSLLRSKKSCHKRSFTPNFNQYNFASNQSPSHSINQKSIAPFTITRKSFSCFSLDSPNETKTVPFERQSEILPSASESNILQAESSFHQRPMRTLSPDSIYFKMPSGVAGPRKNVYSPLELPHKTSTSPFSSRESISPLNVKPPLNKETYKPIKKYSVLGKGKKVTLSPPISPYNLSPPRSSSTNPKQIITPNKKKYTPTADHLRTGNYSVQREHSPNSPASFMDIREKHNFLQPSSKTFHTLPSDNIYSGVHILTSPHSNVSSHSNSPTLEELPRKHQPQCASPDEAHSPSRSSLSRCSDLSSIHSSDYDNNKTYKIKSNYKAFAAIPTNTLLRDQKVIDKPKINEANGTGEETMETRSEMCSPAQLRQQTEEICAEIDEVLHDPLPLRKFSSDDKELETRTAIQLIMQYESVYPKHRNAVELRPQKPASIYVEAPRLSPLSESNNLSDEAEPVRKRSHPKQTPLQDKTPSTKGDKRRLFVDLQKMVQIEMVSLRSKMTTLDKRVTSIETESKISMQNHADNKKTMSELTIQTRPGIIRPMTLKVTVTDQSDEMCYLNPFNQLTATSPEKEITDCAAQEPQIPQGNSAVKYTESDCGQHLNIIE
ncbi:muscular LMNA-interacting protein [Pelodytes ibericus]